MSVIKKEVEDVLSEDSDEVNNNNNPDSRLNLRMKPGCQDSKTLMQSSVMSPQKTAKTPFGIVDILGRSLECSDSPKPPTDVRRIDSSPDERPPRKTSPKSLDGKLRLSGFLPFHLYPTTCPTNKSLGFPHPSFDSNLEHVESRNELNQVIPKCNPALLRPVQMGRDVINEVRNSSNNYWAAALWKNHGKM